MMLIRQVIHKNNLSRKGRDNLVTEIGILKKLKHKFIVDLVDFHWDDKYIYIGNNPQWNQCALTVSLIQSWSFAEEEISPLSSNRENVCQVVARCILNTTFEMKYDS